MLRALPSERGGRPMLTFRYANVDGDALVMPSTALSALVRITMPGGRPAQNIHKYLETSALRLPGGEGVTYERAAAFDARGGPVMAATSYLHHTITETSPFYDAHSPTGERLEAIR